jgi:cob(I)alamin adenosyltransferase
MKLTHRVELSLIIEHLSSLQLSESASADAIGAAIAKIEKERNKSTNKNLGNILSSVINDLHDVKGSLPRKLQNVVSKDIMKLKKIMQSLNLKVSSKNLKLNPKT